MRRERMKIYEKVYRKESQKLCVVSILRGYYDSARNCPHELASKHPIPSYATIDFPTILSTAFHVNPASHHP